MKKVIRSFVFLPALLVLLGASPQPAPVAPAKGFYVNDYANVIFEEHRDRIFSLCTALEKETGARAAVVTVESFGEMSGEEYGRLILDDWFAYSGEQNGAVILVSAKQKQALILAQEALELGDVQALVEKYMLPAMKNANYSKGILEGTKAVLSRIYLQYDLEPPGELAREAQKEGNDVFSLSPFIVLLGVVVLVGRSMRVSSKYRKRYAKGYVYKRRSFSSGRREWDDVPQREEKDDI